MKILYCALAIDLRGSHGGATHATEVTRGLVAQGHEVWLIARGAGADTTARDLDARVTLVPTPPQAAWLMTPRVRAITEAWRPDVVMERFYTFAGGGIIAAHARGIPSVLEVNAPVIDPPGTRKDRIDRRSGQWMRRWATQQCRWATRIVTPLATTVPAAVRAKVMPLQWGANVDRFDPARFPRTGSQVQALRTKYAIPDSAPVIGFVGSFRAWHGAADAMHAFAQVQRTIPDARLLLVGDGPERAAIERECTERGLHGVIFTGTIPYAAVPAHLALCDVAVAPFAPRLHPPLQHFGFYWSPLKVFEALAMAVPVVTTAIAPLIEMVAGCGFAVPEGDMRAFADAVVTLLHMPDRGKQTGEIGRARVIAQWSWQAHCRSLDAVLRDVVTNQ